MVKILLIQPAVSYKEKIKALVSDCPHLGLLYLASSLKKNGYEVQYIDDIDNSFELEEIGNIVRRHSISVVCITAMTQNIKGAIQLSAYLKFKQLPIKTILGGAHISADPTLLQRFPFFDAGIIGESELTLPKMIPDLLDGKNIGTIHALTPHELDALEFPDRNLVDYDDYKKRGFWTNAMFATRGCPYKCNFCNITAINRRVRYRSPKNITEEMKQCVDITKLRTFSFIDDALTLKKDFAISLSEAIYDLPFKIKWEAQTRADHIDKELLKVMKMAGCYKLLFGVESGNERIRNEIIGKKLSDYQIKRATDLCWEVGIEPDHYLILGQPTETAKEIEDTINCPLKFKPNIIGVGITIPLPGSKLYKTAIEDGTIPEDVVDKYILGEYGEGYEECYPYYIPKGMTLGDLKEARTKALKQFYFRPAYIWKRIKTDIGSWHNIKRDIVQGWSLLTKGRSVNDFIDEKKYKEIAY